MIKQVICIVLLTVSVAMASNSSPELKPPIKVFLSIDLNSIEAIDSSQGYATFSASTLLRWNMPKGQINLTPGIYDEAQLNKMDDQVWLPGLSVQNAYGVPVIKNKALYVKASGEIQLLQHWWFSIKSSFYIKQFPFDDHALELTWFSPIYNNTEMILEVDPLMKSQFKVPDLPQWHESSQGVTQTTLAYHGTAHSGLSFNMTIERKPWFYITKFILPIIILVYLSMTALWMRDDPTANRCALPLTCLLSIVAFQWMVNSVVPKVDYQLLIDSIILTAYMSTSTVLMSIVLFNHCSFFIQRPVLRHRIRWCYLLLFPCFLALVVMSYLI
ncbi:MAG: hypothetical protein CMF51_00840 [Legionellales bacterium]|nr:hypothetical protein [Legionellales bacterium]|tara:strand:- start:906 stop:1892 length:987 start_codon:yes stop_codon:yes gene_type:complete